jgi:hypothetical protein
MTKKLKIGIFTVYIITVVILLSLDMSGSTIKIHRLIFGIPSDKYIHALLFLPFMIICSNIYNRSNFIIHLFIGLFFASICESLHYFLPYREFSIHDFYANAIGIMIGSLSYLIKKY